MKQIWLSMLVLGCVPAALATPESQTFDDYTIHLNAFNSDTLQPSMAKAYNIIRSKNRGLLTVSVVKKSATVDAMPVAAHVKAKATNLTGQLKHIKIREIRDGDAVYYISVFPVADKETLDFTIHVTTKDNKGPYVVKMRQQFFTQ
jgi:hypothetical protein